MAHKSVVKELTRVAADMSDKLVNALLFRMPVRHVALQCLIKKYSYATLHDSERLSLPGRVNPASGDAASRIVEPPQDCPLLDGEPKLFSGPAALKNALEYSHCAYGSAVCFSQ